MQIKLTVICRALAIAATLIPLNASAQTDLEDRVAERNLKVTVINHNWADVRVYAVSSSYTVRLGMVSGLGRATFTVPRVLPLHGDFQLAIRPIGQRTVHYSQPILASAGDVVEYTVHNHLGLSNAIVY
jgi:hypothetical protein